MQDNMHYFEGLGCTVQVVICMVIALVSTLVLGSQTDQSGSIFFFVGFCDTNSVVWHLCIFCLAYNGKTKSVYSKQEERKATAGKVGLQCNQ